MFDNDNPTLYIDMLRIIWCLIIIEITIKKITSIGFNLIPKSKLYQNVLGIIMYNPKFMTRAIGYGPALFI